MREIVSLPGWLLSFLTSGWLNIERGRWLDVFGFGIIPPFSFQPGMYILKALELVILPINLAYDFGSRAWDMAWDALSKATSALFKIDTWVLGAVGWFTGQITGWWSATWIPIYSGLLTMIGHAGDLAGSAWDWIDNAGGWIKTYTDPIYTWIGAILENYVAKVDLADLFRPIQEFMDFVNTVKQDMVDFFTDPWDFLYKKFDDFFERFW